MSDSTLPASVAAPTHPTTPPDAPSREEHYKILIEDARALGQRRETINDLFLGLTTLALGAQGYLLITGGDNDVRPAAFVAAISLLGFYLCGVWRQVLNSYKGLLAFRYDVLRQWETNWFPEEQRYYVSEDGLYDPNVGDHPPTSLIRTYVDELRKKNKLQSLYIGTFVDLYKVMPRTARIVFVLMALVRPAFFLIAILPKLLAYFGY